MLFGEPSNICTDCGASPQDMRHLFGCNAHPTDLSSEDLWRNPVGSVRAFSYVDDRDLDWLDDGPSSSKQQLRTHKSPFLKSYLHRVNANSHSSPLFPFATITQNTHNLSNCTHICKNIVTPGFVETRRWRDGTAGQMDGKTGWWTTSGTI